MTVFLTSSPTGPLDRSRIVDGFDGKNRLIENLMERWKAEARCLLIAAAPEQLDRNDEMRGHMMDALEKSGFSFRSFDLWDDRTCDFSAAALQSYDVIFLGGGHVPTQNAFFHRIGLRETIQGFGGLVIGISAGTMNCADVVYAQPELPGEAADPHYLRFLEGLGLTRVNVLPHYQMIKDAVLDGQRVFEDITYGDSVGREFLAIPDGSYLLSEQGTTAVYGEAYRIADGAIEKICEENQSRILLP